MLCEFPFFWHETPPKETDESRYVGDSERIRRTTGGTKPLLKIQTRVAIWATLRRFEERQEVQNPS